MDNKHSDDFRFNDQIAERIQTYNWLLDSLMSCSGKKKPENQTEQEVVLFNEGLLMLATIRLSVEQRLAPTIISGGKSFSAGGSAGGPAKFGG